MAEVRVLQSSVGNTFIFKVSLDKQTWRRIRISSKSTLEHLNNAIQKGFKFNNDHMHAFFMDGKAWSPQGYWDKRQGKSPRTDKVQLEQLGLKKGKKFLYLYDYGDEWHFNVALQEIVSLERPSKQGEIIEIRGEAPTQYPDFDYLSEEEFSEQIKAGLEESLEELMEDNLARAQIDFEKWLDRLEAKLWQQRSPDWDLRDFLQDLTNDELTVIRQNLNITGVSNLKKDQLVQVLEKEIVNSIDGVLRTLDNNQWDTLNSILKPQKQKANLDIPTPQVLFFRQRGLVFTGTINNKKFLAIPWVIREKLQELAKDNSIKQAIKINTQWVRINYFFF